MPDLLPPGGDFPDLRDPHYRYLWRAQYDDLKTGPWVGQLDAEGRERSVALLDWKRVVRIEVYPMQPGRPTLELRVNRALGEIGLKKWVNDISTPPAKMFILREVIGLTLPQGGEVRCYYIAEDNRIIMTTSEDIDDKVPLR